MIGWLVRAILAAWFLAAPCAVAHEIRPAYLQIDQTDTHAFDVLWKVPSRGNTVLDIQPEFDAGFHLTKAGMEAGQYQAARWREPHVLPPSQRELDCHS
jgi:hypothetical protein